MKAQEHSRIEHYCRSKSSFEFFSHQLQSINIDSNSHMTANTNEIIILTINTCYELRLRLLDGWLGVKMIQQIHNSITHCTSAWYELIL